MLSTIVQTVYDRAFQRHATHELLYRGWYGEYLKQLETHGAAGIEGGGGDASPDDEEGPWGGKIYEQLYAALTSIFRQALAGDGPRRLLELGAGTGYLSCKMAGPDLRVELIDREPLAVEVSRCIAGLLEKSPFVTASCADVFELEAGRSPYDVVFSLGLLEELDPAQRQHFLAIGWRLTKPGGIFLAGVPNFASPVMIKLWHQHGKANESFLSQRTLRRLFREAGFEDVTVAGAGSVIPSKGISWPDLHLSSWIGMFKLAWGIRPSNPETRTD